MTSVPTNLPFEQLASYDKPAVLLTQAMDNEFTLRGALQTLVDADGLSPQERDSFTDRLKDRVGRSPVTDAVVDVVTNPFVLLMMVTSPAARTALSRTGKAIFDVGERYSPYIKEQGGMLASLGLLAPMQLFRGTALTPGVQAFTKAVDQAERQMMEAVADPLRKVLQRHGLESLDPRKIRDPRLKEKAQELNDALTASLNGFDRGDTFKVLKRELYVRRNGGLRKVSKKLAKEEGLTMQQLRKEARERGTVKLKTRDVQVGALVKADMDEVVGKLGLTELRDAYRKALSDRRMMLFGDEAASAAAGKFVADEQKLLRITQGIQFGTKKGTALQGTAEGVMKMIMDPDTANLLVQGRLDAAEVKSVLKEVIEGQPTFFLPRNLRESVGEAGIDKLMQARRARALTAAGSTRTRTRAVGDWDPRDMERVFQRYGATDYGLKKLVGQERKIQAMVDRGLEPTVLRMNSQESLARYFRDTGVTNGLYVTTVEDSPLLLQRMNDARQLASKEKLDFLEKEIGKSPFQGPKRSLAQLFQEEHFLLEDRFAKESLEVMLRGALGIQKVEHVATHMALVKAKQGLRTVLDSGVGKAMQGAGSWGRGLYKRLDDVANAELTLGEGKGLAGQLARYFYVTHLGLNLGSVTMNLMQPLLYASVYGGVGNVLKAYGSAFKELGGYMKERTGKFGFRALTDQEHQQLVSKHFKFANAEGENLVQIGRDTFSTLDSISYKSEALAGVSRRESYFFDYPMKLFEKAEWINRNVAAHSVENAYRAAGIDVARGSSGYYRMLSDVGEMVSATQFGGSTLNTPMAFQGTGPFGRLANNPLFRQFLSFPLRSATTIMYDSPRLADRGLGGIGADFVRGMGISAVLYEFGKNTFGADLSPGLFGASLTQIAGGDRFFQDGNEWIPIPPVVDIPMNLVRGALDPGQRDLLQNNLPRLVPGGIAASRAMGMLPNLMEGPLFGLPGALQKTYIDPKQRTEDGKIAVFKGDGTLVDYQSPGLIFAKALGVDMGKFREAADFDGFLLKNREQIVDYRRRAISALLGNEIGKMQGIRAEFKRRFGMDLTISKDQLDEAIKNRTISRTERILDRMPPDQRPMYQQMAAARAAEMGVEPEAIVGADTARQRAESRRVQAVPLTEEQRQVIATEPGFKGFEGF
jgi:hypothetical protein